VKVILLQELRLCTGRMAHRGCRGIALLFYDHSTRRGWGVSVTPRPLYTRGKEPVPIVQDAGWAPGPVWTGTENLVLTRIRSPDHPARSQSICRSRYPALSLYVTRTFILGPEDGYNMFLRNVCRSWRRSPEDTYLYGSTCCFNISFQPVLGHRLS
jgi:hypothetical protein